MVLDKDTLARSGLVGAILGRFLVVTVPMEQLKIHQCGSFARNQHHAGG
jgi:hypothetical protein